jgi:hypothetical protein
MATSAAPSPLLRGLMLWALYAIPLVVAIRPVGMPIYDPDIWWHLRVGEWVVEHRAVTTNDPFSQYGQDRRWVAYSWLYEVVVYGLYQAFGLAGVIVYRALMALAIVAAVHALVRRLEPRFLVATGLTAAAVLALAMLFSERPWLVTVLCSTLTLHAVVALRQPGDPPRWVWTLPIVFVLWANVHIQFVYGLFILGLGVVAPWVDHLLRAAGLVPAVRTAETSSAARPPLLDRRLVTLSLLCFLATFVTPYHFRLYLVVVEYATQPGPFKWVSELTALKFREASDWMLLAMTFAACFALGRKRWSSFEALLLVSSAFFAFRAMRDLWFLILADLVILASFAPAEVPEEDRFRLRPAGVVALLAGLALVAVGRVFTQDLSPKGLRETVGKVFPAKAADHVRAQGYAGPLYNDFNWGGYLIWALPELPVAIDGRTNLHGDERTERFARVWTGMPGWDSDPDLAAAGVVVAPVEAALSSLLRLDRRFELVHEDELACVFVRAGGRR